MQQKKNSPLFYEARDSVESGNYLKAKTKTLQKYLAELSIVQSWESDCLAWGAVQRKHEWIQKIELELQTRKDKRWESFHSYKRGIIIGLICTVLGGIILFFVLQSARKQEYQDKSEMLSPQQRSPEQSTIKPLPPASPTNKDKNQKIKKEDNAKKPNKKSTRLAIMPIYFSSTVVAPAGYLSRYVY